MENKKIRILIADDQNVFLIGLKSLLQGMPEVEVIGEASNGAVMVEKAIALRPDIVLTDINMPVLDGIAASRQLLNHMPESKVIALSSFAKDDYILQMLEMGAMGYLAKTAAVQEIKDAIFSVYNKNHYFCKEVSLRLSDLVSKTYQVPLKTEPVFSDRELEIIRLICVEYTSKEIALNLHLSKRTVEGHRTRIMDKIGAKSIAGIITFAVKNNIHNKED